jgi:hypothetical protein
MAGDFEVVDLWVGTFTTESAFEDYLRETYEEDDTPLSKFAADMGESFYDHDFIEVAYHQEPSSDLEALLQEHSFARSYSPKAVAAHGCLVPCAVNAVILVWGKKIEAPRSVRGTDYQIHYLGRYDCDPKS